MWCFFDASLEKMTGFWWRRFTVVEGNWRTRQVKILECRLLVERCDLCSWLQMVEISLMVLHSVVIRKEAEYCARRLSGSRQVQLFHAFFN